MYEQLNTNLLPLFYHKRLTREIFRKSYCMLEFDYVVIGTGPGGYVSAIRAAQLGLKVAAIEKEEPGGVCLNWGCIPTKTLLHSAHMLHELHSTKAAKIEYPVQDLSGMVSKSRKVAGRLNQGIRSLFKKYKVSLYEGVASLESENSLSIKSDSGIEKLKAKNICLATGAKPRELPFLKFSDKVWNSRAAMMQKELPENLLVIGAGAIGMEFADFYASLGAKVTVIEMADHILPLEEPFLGKQLTSILEKKGIRILTKATLEDANEEKTKISATIRTSNGDILKEGFSHALLSVGVTAITENLGMENTSATLENGLIKVNSEYKIKGTTSLYAIGDVIGGKQLAHKASHEGVIVAEQLAGKKKDAIASHQIPSCIYTSPQIASYGYSEAQLNEQDIPFIKGEFPFMASGKALAMNGAEGSNKVYLHKDTGEILGAHLIGPEVTELISNFALARQGELTADEILETVFPHPTLAESVFESVAAAYGQSCNS
jgi:dihydrolipoamide dehydrogenase